MDKLDTLTWEAPPVSLQNRQRRNWQNVADALKSKPGQWAVVAIDVSASTGTHIRHGRLTAFAPEGAFEARVQGARDATTGRANKVYARYVGENQEFANVEAPAPAKAPATAKAKK